jgi:excisionase family DNA binding protein
MSVSDLQRRLLTLDAVAERLGYSRRTVERKVAAGEIPSLQLGGKGSAIRIDALELSEWLYRDSAEDSSPPDSSERARRTAGFPPLTAAVEAPPHSEEP